MKKSVSYKAFLVFNTIFLILLSFIFIYPYLNQFAIAFNEGMDTARGGITIFPRKFTWINFQTILGSPDTVQAAIISVTRTILNVVLALFVTFSAAYALTRRGLKYGPAITKYFMLTMYLHAGVIPIYILYRYLGLIDNFLVYVVPFAFSFYNMVIMRSFIQELPDALEEAALIDGANEIQIMFKIILPLSKPVLATVALWIAVGQWNDYSTTLYYITDKDLYSLQYLLMRVIQQGDQMKSLGLEMAMGSEVNLENQTTSESMKAAMLIVTTLPIICVYPFLQKYFVKGVTIGSVKG